MNPNDILIPAILVFGLLVLGLVLTVIEFRQTNKKNNDSRKDKKTWAWYQASFRAKKYLDINIPGPQRVSFNKLAARLDFVAHEHGEHAIGFDGVVDLHFE